MIRRPVVQVAYAVTDVRQAALRWAETTGVGPFFVYDHFPVPVARSGAEAALYDHTAAFAQWGEVQLELISLHVVEPPAFADAIGLDRLGFHHVAFIVEDIDDESSRLEDLGWPCIFDGQGGTGTRFLFHDARTDLGHHIELYATSPQLLAHYDAVRRASIGWDGSRPIRDFAERPVR